MKKTRQNEEANEVSAAWPDDDVILYDGVCIFCSRWVRFVAKRDVDRRFRFTPIQSPYGTRLARPSASTPADPDTNAVIHGGVVVFQVRRRADRAVAIYPDGIGRRRCSRCQSRCATPCYNLVARNRYRIFGKYDDCFVPDADMRVRVME